MSRDGLMRADETTRGHRIWRPKASWLGWWRLTGFSGIVYGGGTVALALFPAREFFRTRTLVMNPEEFLAVREASILQVGYAEAVLAGAFLLIFSSGLRSYLSRAEGGYSMWSHLVLGAGAVAASVTLAAHPLMRTLVLAGPASFEPSLLRAAVWFEAAVESTVAVPLATMVLAASVVDLKTKVFGRWPGGMGLFVCSLLLVGAAWPLQGSAPGLLAFVFLYGRLLLALWLVTVGLKLVVVNAPPLHVPGEGLFDPGPMIEGWSDEPL